MQPTDKRKPGQSQTRKRLEHMSIDERVRKNKAEREQKAQNQHPKPAEAKKPGKKQKSKLSSGKKKAPKKTPKKQKSKFGFFRFFQSSRDVLCPPDLLVVELTVILLVIGLVMVFSASSYRSILENGSAYTYIIKQAVFAVLGLACMLGMIIVPPEILRKVALPALVVFMGLIGYTAFLGEESLGATRWISIAGMRFTPAELAKPCMILVLSDLIKESTKDLYKSRKSLVICAVLLATVALVAKEDLGSGLVIFLGCFATLIVAGLSRKGILAIVGAACLAVVGAVVAEPYRIVRILGFLGLSDSSSGSDYQITQSLYAFGSGGLVGSGLGNSGQKLLYLPGMHTDFIYSVIGEELGLIGAVIVLALFMTLAWRGFWLASRISDNYKSYTVFGIVAMFIIQALINMGVAVGLLPVTGITLPLISYGGTSLLVTLISMGIVLNFSRFADKQSSRKSVRRKRNRE